MKTLEKPKRRPGKPRRKVPSRYVPKTPLGKKLWVLRQELIGEGGRLLDWDGLEREVSFVKGQTD